MIGLFAWGVARADVVTQWNGLMLDAVRGEDLSPTLAARGLAILHVAMYDAVNSVERSHRPFYADIGALPGTSAEAAAASAAHEVMLANYPTEGPVYEAAYASYIGSLPPGPGTDGGVLLGAEVAARILEWRGKDGVTTVVPYVPNPAPGHWRRTPPFFRPPDSPQCPFVVPFAMVRGDQFRPPGPPELTSARYAGDLATVRELGSATSKTRTAEQTQIARFWSDFSYTVTPGGHWNQIAATIAASRGNTLAENARLFALLNITLAEAGIVCWDGKYAYDFWRPITAIREADTDGNPDTVADPTWNSLLNAPSFPEYTSGHSTFSKSAAVVLARFYGTDAIAFTIGNDTLPGVTRSFTSLAEAAAECGQSRIYGGIHFPSSNQDSKVSGERLAEYVVGNFLLPNDALPKLSLVLATDGELLLQLHGVAGLSYIVDASRDLQVWTSISTNTAAVRGVVITNAAPASESRRYFRVRTEGP